MKKNTSGYSKMRIGMLVLLAALIGIAFLKVSSAEKQVPPSETGAEPPIDNHTEAVRATDESSVGTGVGRPTDVGGTEHGAPQADYTTSRKCVLAYRQKDDISTQLKVCEDAEQFRGDVQHAQFFASCDARAERFGRRLNDLGPVLASCEVKSRGEAEAEFYSLAKRAAAAGDVDAQLCYVRGAFELGRPWTEQEKLDYRRDAKTYLENGFKRGDWRFVELLRLARPGVIAQSGLLGEITKGDLLTEYRMNRLLSLGASDANYREYLENLADDPGKRLPAQEVREANEWARTTFAKNFVRSPRLDASPDPCSAHIDVGAP